MIYLGIIIFIVDFPQKRAPCLADTALLKGEVYDEKMLFYLGSPKLFTVQFFLGYIIANEFDQSRYGK